MSNLEILHMSNLEILKMLILQDGITPAVLANLLRKLKGTR